MLKWYISIVSEKSLYFNIFRPITYRKTAAYIAERNWMPITPIYNIVNYEPKSKEELEKYAMSIYIGVSENIL